MSLFLSSFLYFFSSKNENVVDTLVDCKEACMYKNGSMCLPSCVNCHTFHFETLENFNIAFHNNDLESMEKYYTETHRNNYYLDVALDEGKTELVQFFLNKGVKPSLFANQMARSNGYNKLATKVESQADFRNKVNIQNVYYNYDRHNKSMNWNIVVPQDFRY